MTQSQSRLGFNGTWSMAVGGMIGGGIFSTLGVVIGIAGAWAWLSFPGFRVPRLSLSWRFFSD